MPDQVYAFPMSFAQRRLWFLFRLDPASAVYNMPAVLEITGTLDAARLEAALAEIVRRHEALRTSFDEVDGAQMQLVSPEVSLKLPVRGANPEEIEARIAAQVVEPFDLRRWPLFRAELLRLPSERHVLLFCVHHIVFDGWSMGVLTDELARLYRGETLPELQIQYADYSHWQTEQLQGKALEQRLSFWRSALEGAPGLLQLPCDRPRPSARSPRGGSVSFRIDRAQLTRLEACAKAHDATLFMALLSAWGAFLGRISRQEDLVIGSPVANRPMPELEPLIGFFVNLLPLRIRLEGSPCFATLIERVKATCLDAFSNQDMPFEKLIEALAPQRRTDHAPLVQATFALDNVPGAALRLPGLSLRSLRQAQPIAKFDLSLLTAEGPQGLDCELEYSADLFDEPTVRALAGHFATMLAGLLEAPNEPVSRVPLLSAEQTRLWLETWTHGGERREPKPIHVLVEAQAAANPAAPAVVWNGTALAYGELNRRANRLARRLGVKPGSRVGIHLERSFDLVVALLAVLKAGAAYVPLDRDDPSARIAEMMRDAGLTVVIGRESLEGARLVVPDGAGEDANLGIPVAAAAPAYVIYTSGSTGGPKGVVVPHRAIDRLVRDANYVRLDGRSRVAHAASASFDAATFEIWGALVNGGAIIGIEKETALAPALLAAALRDFGVTHLFVTTALFNQVAREHPAAFNGLSAVLFGGEAVTPSFVRAVLAQGGPAELLHVYGPTETTTFASWHRVLSVPEDALTVPIGRPASRTSLYVLDPFLQPAPDGVAGELWIGGEGVADGYLGAPILTAERFVDDPFVPGGKLYRTGDLCRVRAGVIEFLGRIDQQVKIRGFRVEPAEIEQALRLHGAVADCAVLLRETAHGNRQLVAWLAPKPGVALPDERNLRVFLEQRLPAWMIPARFVAIERLPLTRNRKVDRNALADADLGVSSALAQTAQVMPRTETERVLAAIWVQVLERERISVHDNFFDLGGHSLLATRIVSRVRDEFKIELPLRLIFEKPDVESLARHIDALRLTTLDPDKSDDVEIVL